MEVRGTSVEETDGVMDESCNVAGELGERLLTAHVPI